MEGNFKILESCLTEEACGAIGNEVIVFLFMGDFKLSTRIRGYRYFSKLARVTSAVLEFLVSGCDYFRPKHGLPCKFSLEL